MQFSTWKQTGKYFTYKEKHSIFYQEAGTGEVLILLHGFPTASWDWHKIWQPLSEKYRLIAPDFIGFGYSDKPQKYNYSIHDQADLIEALAAHLELQKVHILAHDYGDTVLQELLARDIDRRKANISTGLQLQSIVLLNGGLFPETHLARPIQKALLSPFGFMLTPFLSKKMLRKTFHQIFGKETPPSEKEMDEFYTLMDFKKGQRIFHKLIHYMTNRIQHRERWVAALQNSPAPIRIIDGAADPISGEHMTKRYTELVENADIVLLKEIGHYPQTEAPERVLVAYLEFRK
ncbi:MAG: alpha/beta hydrolase [Chitinophagales bacterium]